MADHGLFDIQWVLSVARNRWLRAEEICQMLLNQLTLPISEQPPLLPCSGSIYFYDRRVTRFFRNDGLDWKKRKNGKTINEAHEKLKVGNVYRLHCYYSRGEHNPNFQRRIYSMIDKELMHIAFVHYLDAEITCGSSSLPSYLVDQNPPSLLELHCNPSNSLLELRTQDVNVEGPLESCCSIYELEIEQPAQHLDQRQLVIISENDTHMQRNLSCHIAISETSSNGERAEVQNSVLSSFDWPDDVLPLPDEVHLLGGSPSVSDIDDSLSLSKTEKPDRGKNVAAQNMGLLDYTHETTSFPDIVTSLDPVDVVYGLQEYQSMHLSCDPLVFGNLVPDFCEEDHAPFPYADLLSHELGDSQSIIDDFISTLEGARRKWKKIYMVTRLFSIRNTVLKRASARRIPR